MRLAPGTRVVDRVTGEMGTVVAESDAWRHTRYLIDWDRPTPYQDQAWVEIPSQYFDWATRP